MGTHPWLELKIRVPLEFVEPIAELFRPETTAHAWPGTDEPASLHSPDGGGWDCQRGRVGGGRGRAAGGGVGVRRVAGG